MEGNQQVTPHHIHSRPEQREAKPLSRAARAGTNSIIPQTLYFQ